MAVTLQDFCPRVKACGQQGPWATILSKTEGWFEGPAELTGRGAEAERKRQEKTPDPFYLAPTPFTWHENALDFGE